jgi:signal transduction histidine kinase
MKAERTLTLRTRRAERGFLEAAVEDTGCGMTEETRTRAFDLFFTTKDSGTGLGMAIARTVVEQHGGRLDIRSHWRGTQVRVLLPLRREAGSVVDRRPAIAEGLRLILERDGYAWKRR